MSSDAIKSTSESDSPLSFWLILIGILIATGTVYAQTYDDSFVNFDDDVHVYQNVHVNTGLTGENVKWAFGIHGPSQWHPLSWLSHQLDVELFGLDPAGHHAMNVLLHTANAVLLFLTLRYATRELWPSAVVALVFAVHPLNVESVAWISERRNVLSLLFGCLTILAYCRYVSHRSPMRYALVVAAFGLGLMAKPMLVTLPFVLLLLDYWPLGRIAWPQLATTVRSETPWRQLILEKVPLLGLSAVSGVLTILCQQSIGTVASTSTLPVAIRLTNMLSVYGIYCLKFLWPVDLAVFYPHPGFWQADPLSWLATSAVAGAVLLLVMTVLAAIGLKRYPYLAVGWLWYLGTLFPMIGVIQVGRQQMADRYMYLSIIGLLIAIVWLGRSLVATRRIHWTNVCCAVTLVVVGCMSVSWYQTSFWQDSVTLFQRAIAVTSQNSWAHNNLGKALHERGQSLDAFGHYVEALRIDPEYALAHYNLGVVYQDLGRSNRAIPQFENAVQLNPEYVDARLRLGAALAQSGRMEDAVRQFQEALQLAPDHADLHLNLGIVYGRMSKTVAAIAEFRTVLEIRPDDLKARFGLAAGLRAAGESHQAEQLLREILEDVPGSALAYYELGVLLLERGDRQQATECFRQTLRHNPGHADAAMQLQQLSRP